RLAGHERLGVTIAVQVVAAGGAVADGGTRNRAHAGVAAGVECRRAWHLDRVAPAAIRVADHEGVLVPAPAVVAAGGAVAGRATRDREHAAVRAAVERRRA